MPDFRKWVLTLAVAAATPGLAAAGPLEFLKKQFAPRKPAASREAAQSNQKTAEQIAAALRQAKLSGYEMEVTFRDGIATLSGQVRSAGHKAQATQVASRVPGVKRVDNRLTLMESKRSSLIPAMFRRDKDAPRATPSKRSPAKDATAARIEHNQKKAQQIAGALSSAGLSGYDIEIQYQDGVAQLAGTVGDAGQVRQALHTVQRIPGVRSVNNRLQVAGGSSKSGSRGAIRPAAFQPETEPPPAPGAAGPPVVPPPPGYAHGAPVPGPMVLNQPYVPEYAWPSYAAYPNYAQVNYPAQYSASAWPYIGPFYPYPQVPLGWREASLVWDDGYWSLQFSPRTDRWWWFLHPKNWSSRGGW